MDFAGLMQTPWLWLLGLAALYAVGYRYYSAFLAARILAEASHDPTPAHRLADGRSYVASNRWVLLGHHFAAISGAGPIIGPVLAAQWGFAPGLLWIVFGAVLAGAVHDLFLLVASLGCDGQSLLHVIRRRLGPAAGWFALSFLFFLLLVTMAGAGVSVISALADNAWGVFTVASTIPVAMLTGLYLRRWRPGRVVEATVFGLLLLALSLGGGALAQTSAWGEYLRLSRAELEIILPVYAFFASILPVWLLLVPRDYISSYLKVGVIVLLLGGLCFSGLPLVMPAVTPFVDGTGPVFPGKGCWPFLFVTIACGAMSGYHAVICCGTTPKMIFRARDARLVGYGAMLVEGLVAAVVLLTVAVMQPGDYFTINTTAQNLAAAALAHPEFADATVPTPALGVLEDAIGQPLAGRPGGPAALGAAMAGLLTWTFGGGKTMLGFWYAFAIVFQAVFILTLIDAGTRAGRYLLQEALGQGIAGFRRTDAWWPAYICGAVVCVGWGILIRGGSIEWLWPLFGVNNQLLGCLGLSLATGMLRGRARWCTALPLLVLIVAASHAAWYNVAEYLRADQWLIGLLQIALWLVAAVLSFMSLLRAFADDKKAMRN